MATDSAPFPDNLLHLDYHQVPPHACDIPGGIIDVHNHTGEPAFTRTLVEAARAYGITEFYTMAALEQVVPLQQAFPGQFHFIAIPAWQTKVIDAAFFADWRRRLDGFAELGCRMIKFHAAPGTCRRWGITLDDPRIQEIAAHAYNLGFNFMTHIGDPKAWFYGSGVYADGTYEPFEKQFAQLERLLEKYPDRLHMGAHMGGSLEQLEPLARRLERFPHYILDTSATKWIVRAVAEQPTAAVRDFIIQFQDRILFGSDNVVGENKTWDHFASRYWAHQMLWETDYDGRSPIADPDANKGFHPARGTFDGTAEPDAPPHLKGLSLPPEVLRKIYRTNALRLLPR